MLVCCLVFSLLSFTEPLLHELKGSWCSEEKAALIVDLIEKTHPLTCVEVGAFNGASMLPIAWALQKNGEGHLYAIDAWSNAEAIQGIKPTDPNWAWWGVVDMKAMYKECKGRLFRFGLEPYCTLIWAPSREAASQIDAIDFLNLDGNFSEEGALLDVELYVPKVRSGGYILFSNLFIVVDGKPTKMKALEALFQTCDIVCQVDNQNTALFRKR